MAGPARPTHERNMDGAFSSWGAADVQTGQIVALYAWVTVMSSFIVVKSTLLMYYPIYQVLMGIQSRGTLKH
jgi:hypothetical protein